jgi:ribonucleoside-diphosphate reductase subunit M1
MYTEARLPAVLWCLPRVARVAESTALEPPGTPYMMFKDACNSKSNQRHLGTIRGSNLCTEIVEYTSEDEVAVCNLASIALPRFVLPAEGGEGGAPARFDLEALHEVSRVVARSLDRVIDRSEYPLVEARNSNLRHRPVGIGVQGLADAFALLGMPFESADAAALNRDIFEALYHGALEASCELAEQLGAHPSHPGSPASQGELQYDMWGVTPSTRWDWAGLKARIAPALTLTLSLTLTLTTNPNP